MKAVLKPTVRRLTSSPLQVGLSPDVKESWLEKESFLKEKGEQSSLEPNDGKE